MTSQDDLGMLWYGVSGVSFNPADPAEVMLNTSSAAPLLSDHPRTLAPQPSNVNVQHAVGYADPSFSNQVQMQFDLAPGDFVNQGDYIYDPCEGYDEDSSGNSVVQHNRHSESSSEQVLQDPLALAPKTKKPKVHHHPALKLKTPIAYQKDTDLNAIPIMKEGMAVCEKCGAIGVKHAFYGKERKFCSLSCARPTSAGTRPVIHDDGENAASGLCDSEGNTVTDNCQVMRSNSIMTSTSPIPRERISVEPQNSVSYSSDLEDSFDWACYMDNPDFNPAPVSCFKHAPMADCWDQITPGMKVEVSCHEEALAKDAFWVAAVINTAGYKAKLRYEGFVEDSSKDFWVDLCSEEVHPVGWCATQGKPLIPPKSIQTKYSDWKEFLLRRLTGARTLPSNFRNKVMESQRSRFRPSLNVEVVDKNRIAQMRVATVTEVIGKRLHLKYHGAPPDDNGFWCHQDSPVIHPVGWSREVGHEIVASQSYHEKCIRGIYDENDTDYDYINQPPTPSFLHYSKLNFADGMKLEAVDPLNLTCICVATVMKVLRNNYLMIRIDSYENDDTCSDWFCYHATSRSIFPPGFCEMNGIPLTPPKGHEGPFSWYSYLKKSQAIAAPPALFNKDIIEHGFQEGMSVEACDLIDPRLVCVATVQEVKGCLLRIHFDGWDSEFDQWVDCESPDIYPVGWCQMSNYKLEPPRVVDSSMFKRRSRGRSLGRKLRISNRKDMYKAFDNSSSSSSRTNHLSTKLSKNQVLKGGTGRRGRPPKGRGRTSTLTPIMADAVYGDFSEFDNDGLDGSSIDLVSPWSVRNHRNSRGTRIRGASRTLLSRTKAASHSDTPQDDEEEADDTSSGVASLAESENSDAWGIEELSQNSASKPDISFAQDDLAKKSSDVQDLLQDQTQIVLPLAGNLEMSEKTFFPSLKPTMAVQPTMAIPSAMTLFPNVDSMPAVAVAPAASLQPPSCVTSSETWVNAIPGTVPDNTFNEMPISGGNSEPSSSYVQEPAVMPAVVTNKATPAPNPPADNHFIPRLVDGPVNDGSKAVPKLWGPHEVAQFLTINGCGTYCQNFINENITGERLLLLSQNEVMGLTGMKVGPSLKIHDLIQQLLALVSPAQARYQATRMKRNVFAKN